MPVQGAESPHLESTARIICEFCDARSEASLADATLPDQSIKRWQGGWVHDRGLRHQNWYQFDPYAKHAATHMLSKVQDPLYRKIRNIECRSVGAYPDEPRT
jgi:hypothetical protein